jgi:hypothetical protein
MTADSSFFSVASRYCPCPDPKNRPTLMIGFVSNGKTKMEQKTKKYTEEKIIQIVKEIKSAFTEGRAKQSVFSDAVR